VWVQFVKGGRTNVDPFVQQEAVQQEASFMENTSHYS